MFNVIIFLLICHLLSSVPHKVRAAVGHNGRKGVELSHGNR